MTDGQEPPSLARTSEALGTVAEDAGETAPLLERADLRAAGVRLARL